MLRGPLCHAICDTISQHSGLSKLELSNNFLGQTTGCLEPPVSLLARMLIQSRLLEHLDIGFNQIERKSCFCLTHGLRLSRSLLYISVEANPISNAGMRLLMKAKNEN